MLRKCLSYGNSAKQRRRAKELKLKKDRWGLEKEMQHEMRREERQGMIKWRTLGRCEKQTGELGSWNGSKRLCF